MREFLVSRSMPTYLATVIILSCWARLHQRVVLLVNTTT